MTVKQIAEILDAQMVYSADLLDHDIEFAFASDLMSDVLTLDKDNVMLITGLANTQALRTAEMSEINCIVFARGKKVSEDMIELAKENDIAVLECAFSVFKTSGLLYQAGIQPVF